MDSVSPDRARDIAEGEVETGAEEALRFFGGQGVDEDEAECALYTARLAGDDSVYLGGGRWLTVYLGDAFVDSGPPPAETARYRFELREPDGMI